MKREGHLSWDTAFGGGIMLKAPCVCHWRDPSVRPWVGIFDPQSSLKGATYSRVSVGQGPLFNVKWECLFAHQRGVLSCRS